MKAAQSQLSGFWSEFTNKNILWRKLCEKSIYESCSKLGIIIIKICYCHFTMLRKAVLVVSAFVSLLIKFFIGGSYEKS